MTDKPDRKTARVNCQIGRFMEPFKVEHFIASRSGETFPAFRGLSDTEAESLKGRIREKLGLPLSSDDVKMAQNVQSRQSTLVGPVAESEGFDLYQVCATAAIEPSEDVYLYWGSEGTIDQIGFRDLAMFFDDIWYPAIDDIGIFDETFTWLITVDHGGYVGWLRF